MPRDIPVSNGTLLLNFDSNYQIRDVYFPYIGQENHGSGKPFRIGIWVDGEYSWLGEAWEIHLKYRDNTLATDVLLRNTNMGIEIRCNDIVDVELNVYIKKIEVINLIDKKRDVRLFFSHDFNLYGNDIGGTAYFDPRSASIIHYKVHRYFLISCLEEKQWGVRHYTCGRRDETSLTKKKFSEAEGNLDGEATAWGSPYSTIGIHMNLNPYSSSTNYYWIVAGETYPQVAKLNLDVHNLTPETIFQRSSGYWMTWIRKESLVIKLKDLPSTIGDILNRSLLILRTQIDNSGAIIAATDSDIIRFGKDTYSYVWGRDGAFVAAALAKAGYSSICMKYFDYCARVLSEEGYMFQHYNPDGSLASNWHAWIVEGKEVLPIQEDSTALTLWALWIHHENLIDIEFIRPLYNSLILKAANFLVRYRDEETKLPLPSYDLWEERYALHAYTVASVIAGLRAASKFADLFQDLDLAKEYNLVADEMTSAVEKYLYHDGLKRYARSGTRVDGGYKLDEVIDISILGLSTFGVINPSEPRMYSTFLAIREELWLKSSTSGCARYQGDVYQREENSPPGIPGNPWFISTLWIAEFLIEKAVSRKELDLALPYFEWCVKNALPSGVFAEQVDPSNGNPLCVSPLTWSHSAYVWTVLRYIEKGKEL
ncbi:MAG: glycoside hydrolase family 15 protein [Leptospiraceae bacterium]|nr:glycoside hydrolase family 15 protein [Leptospiraceae bacterium]MCP5513588.1 glycoside hydrolase family 15 protein [Leptospiraceae bacterium]